jgi:hypothetical protein
MRTWLSHILPPRQLKAPKVSLAPARPKLSQAPKVSLAAAPAPSSRVRAQACGSKPGRAYGVGRAVVAGALALSLCVMPGCRDTDALKEILYDQEASTVDYDNAAKYYINDSTAQEESMAVSSVEVSEEEPTSNTVQNLIVYSSDPNSPYYQAKQSLFSAFPDFSGIEASSSVCFVKSDSADAVEHAVTAAEAEDDPAEDDNQDADTQEGIQISETGQTGNVFGLSSTGGAEAGTTIEDENGGGTGGSESTPGDYDPTSGFSPNENNGGGNVSVAFNAFDPNKSATDYPVSSFAAVGQYAVMVQMLGGAGALVATDYETLKGFHTAGIAGAGNIAQGEVDSIALGWRDSGSAAYLDADAIIAAFQQHDPAGLARGTCYIIAETSASTYFGGYTEALEKLTAAGIQWMNLRPMDNTEDILANVSDLGTMLSASDVSQYGAESASRANYYAQLHTSTVSAANGGLASVVTDTSKVLETGSEHIASGGNTVYSLLIDTWDASAKYTSHPFAAGLAFASLGCSSTPVSYYLQAGGVINNAAAVASSSATGSMAVTQFSLTTLSPKDSSLTITAPLAISTSNVERALLDSGQQVNATGTGAGLGTAYMPKVIVKSSAIRDALCASSLLSNSVYHPYSWVTSGFVSAAGADLGGSTPYWSSIGANDGQMSASATENPLGSGLTSAHVVVCPSGIFSDWTEGTVESFLLSTWSSAIFGNGYSYSQWQSDVVDFYQWAYGVNIDISTIENQ